MKLTIRLLVLLILYNNANFLFGQDLKNKKSQIKHIDSLFEIAKKDLIGSGDLLKNIIKLSQQAQYPKGEIRSLIKLGVYYTNNSMIDSANIVYDKGEKLIQLYPDLEYVLPYIYNNKAAILSDQELYYKALKYYHKSHEINLKQGDKKMAMITKMNILNCYLFLGEPDKVIAYSTELLEDPKVVRQDDLKHQIYFNLGTAHFDKKEYGKAINWWNANLENIKESDKIGEISSLMTSIADAYRSLGNYEIALDKALEAKKILNNKPGLSDYIASNALVLGKIYNSLDNTDEAIIHFENAILQNPNDPLDIAFSYKNLAAIFKRMNSWDKTATYYEKYGQLIDSLYSKRSKDMYKISEGKIQLIEEEHKNELLTKENDFLTYKNEKQRLYLIITLVIGFCSLLFIFLFFVFYDKNKTNQRKVELLEENEKTILENHLRSKEQEFLATMMSVNERLSKLSLIKKNLSSAIKYNNREEMMAVEKRLESFISSTSDLDILKDRIESQYPAITAQINTTFPDLSANEIRHCLLMKLNLSIKESAQLLSVSTHAVKMARKRLKKKMNVPEDISLKDHLHKNIA